MLAKSRITNDKKINKKMGYNKARHNYVVLIYFNTFLANFNIYQNYITISVINLINVKNMMHLVYLFVQILKKKNSMEEKDSKRQRS